MEKNSEINDILILTFEAGSAEVISEYFLNSKKKKNLKFVLNETTEKIFKEKGFQIKHANQKQLLKKIKQVIFGVSYHGREIKFIRKNNLDNVSNICFLDHWSLYKKRFTVANKVFSPNKIFIFDYHAYKEIKKIKFKKTKIKIIRNPLLRKYLNIKNKIKRKNIVIFLNSINFFKVSRNLNSYLCNKRLIELSLKFINRHEKLSKFPILIKLHPSNNKNNYKKYLKNFKKLKIISTNNLKNILQKTFIAISNESMTLYLANKIGIKTVNITKNNKTIIPRKYCSKIIKL